MISINFKEITIFLHTRLCCDLKAGSRKPCQDITYYINSAILKSHINNLKNNKTTKTLTLLDLIAL